MKKILLAILLPATTLVSCKQEISNSVKEADALITDTAKTGKNNFELIQGHWKNIETDTEILVDGDTYAENVLGDFKDYTSGFVLSDTCSQAPDEVSHQKFLHINSGTFEGCYEISELTADTLKLLMLGTARPAMPEVYVKVITD